MFDRSSKESESMWKRNIVSRALWPASLLYRTAVHRRNADYEAERRRIFHMEVPVICVGNITVGGTGKTPVVEMLARRLKERGIIAAILSRGYRRRSGSFLVVSDGKKLHTTVEQAGDEPFLLASKLPGIPVLVGSDRARSVIERSRLMSAGTSPARWSRAWGKGVSSRMFLK